MPERSSKPKKRPRDVNKLAHQIVQEATGEAPVEPADDGKDPAAVSLGRRGGLKGGRARAEKLSKKRRREIAKKAAAARWTGRAESRRGGRRETRTRPSRFDA